MKRLTTYMIGALVLFTSIYSVPANVMAKKIADMPHCSLCIEEGRSVGKCDSAESENDQKATISQHANKDCGCDITQASHSESTGVFFSNAQIQKGKFFASLLQQDGLAVYINEFARSNSINAPPPSYRLALNTVQQIK